MTWRDNQSRVSRFFQHPAHLPVADDPSQTHANLAQRPAPRSFIQQGKDQRPTLGGERGIRGLRRHRSPVSKSHGDLPARVLNLGDGQPGTAAQFRHPAHSAAPVPRRKPQIKQPKQTLNARPPTTASRGNRRRYPRVRLARTEVTENALACRRSRVLCGGLRGPLAADAVTHLMTARPWLLPRRSMMDRDPPAFPPRESRNSVGLTLPGGITRSSHRVHPVPQTPHPLCGTGPSPNAPGRAFCVPRFGP